MTNEFYIMFFSWFVGIAFVIAMIMTYLILRSLEKAGGEDEFY